MKHKFKPLRLVLLVLFALFAVACDDKRLRTLNEAKEALVIDYAEGDSAERVTQDVTLPTQWQDVDIAWESSDPEVIAEDGTVTRGDADVTVTLTATLTYKNKSTTKQFDLTVKASEPVESDEEAVAAAKTKLEIGFATGDSADAVTQDLTLAADLDGVAIAWKSSAEDVITPAGVVTRQAIDREVTLTATLTKGSATDTKAFTVLVKAGEEAILAEAVASLRDHYEDTLGDPDFKVIGDIELITAIGGATVTWSSDRPEFISAAGKVERPAFGGGDAEVTLTARLEAGGLFETVEFEVTVPELSDVIEETLPEETKVITAEDEDFGYFAEAGVIVSYRPEFKYTELTERDIAAVTGIFAPMPLVYIYQVPGYRDGYATYAAQFELPAEYELVAVGLLVGDTPAAITLGTPDIEIYQASFVKEETGEFMFSFHESIGFSSFRAYLTVESASGTETIYSVVNFGVQVYEVEIDGETQYVVHGERAAEPPAPVRDGYRFDGWFAGDEPFDFNQPITGDVVITAKWTELLRYVSGNVFDLWGPLAEATVKLEDKETTTAADGSFRLDNVPAGAYELIVSAAGYEPKTVSIYAEDFDELEALELADIVLTREFAPLGAIGGDKTVAWETYTTRDNEYLYFKFVTEEGLEADGQQGIGVFLSVSDQAGSVRSAAEILFGFYLGSYITVDHYPNNSKVRLMTGYHQLLNGVAVEVGLDDEGVATINAKIPYDAIGQIIGASYDAYRTYGLSMTSDSLKDGTWDVWYRPDLPGIVGANGEVSRMNPRDYIRVASDNTLFNATNNVNTFVYGRTEPGATVTIGEETATAGEDGYFGIAFSRETEELTLKVEKPGYHPETINMEFDAKRQAYNLGDVDLAEIIIDLEIEVIDAIDGAPLEEVEVIFRGESLFTDAEGKILLREISLASDIVLELRKEGYKTYTLTIPAAAVEDDVHAEVVELYPEIVQVTYSGYVYDVHGPVEGALVFIEELSLHAETDETGYYELAELLLDNYTLRVEKDGYESMTATVTTDDVVAGGIACDFALYLRPAEIGMVGTETKDVTIWDGYLTRNPDYIKLVFTTEDDVDLTQDSREQLDLFFHLQFPTDYMRTDFTFNINVGANGIVRLFNYPDDRKVELEIFEPSFEKGVHAEWVKENGLTRATIHISWDFFGNIDPKYAQTPLSDIWFTMNTVRGSAYHWWTRPDLPGVYLGGEFSVNREVPVDYVRFDSHNNLSVLDNYTLEMFAQAVKNSAAYREGFEFSLENIAQATAGTVKTLLPGAVIFSNRSNYSFSEDIIEVVKGLNYTQGPIEGKTPTTVTEAGYMIMIVPFGSPGNSQGYDILNNTLLDDGWTLIISKQIRVRPSNMSDYFNYYVKWVEDGEVVNYGKWNVPVYRGN